jgi:hypothetical protein
VPEDPHIPPAPVLLIRLWHETGHPSPLRARLTASGGPPDRELWSATTADTEQVIAMVRRWLADFSSSIPG